MSVRTFKVGISATSYQRRPTVVDSGPLRLSRDPTKCHGTSTLFYASPTLFYALPTLFYAHVRTVRRPQRSKRRKNFGQGVPDAWRDFPDDWSDAPTLCDTRRLVGWPRKRGAMPLRRTVTRAGPIANRKKLPQPFSNDGKDQFNDRRYSLTTGMPSTTARQTRRFFWKTSKRRVARERPLAGSDDAC